MKEKTQLIPLSFEISSDLDLIPGVVGRIVERYSFMFDDLYLFEVAVYEAVYNAIEHGNLEITRSRKERMLEEGTYDEFLKKAACEKKCNSKKVKINSSCYDDLLEISIEDEGKGFNWVEELENAKTSAGQGPDRFNGYGLRIILTAFDDVFYNEKGNRMTLVKFKKNPGGQN